MSKISLNQIHRLFKEKGFHYSSSQTNSVNNNLFIDFSTGRDGRGNYVEMRLGDDYNDIEYWFPSGNIKHTNITNKELINFIKKDIKTFGS
jgi:hypothetical protein